MCCCQKRAQFFDAQWRVIEDKSLAGNLQDKAARTVLAPAACLYAAGRAMEAEIRFGT